MYQGERLGERARAVWGERRGGGTLEFVVWTAAFAAMLALVADLSMIYATNASMWDAARDGARRVALHEMTAEEAKAHAARAVALGDPGTYDVTVVAGADGGDVVVTITAPVASAAVFGLYSAISPGDLTARVTMMQEPK